MTTTALPHRPDPVRATVVVGAADDAVPLAPVVRALGAEAVAVRVLDCGARREVVTSLLDQLDVPGAVDLTLWQDLDPTHPLASHRVLEAVGTDLASHPADVVVVHGDSRAAFAGTVGGYYAGVPVANVGAGLPGPTDPGGAQDVDRRLTARLTTWHFAPTAGAREHVVRAQVDPAAVDVAGSTTIDNLRWTLEQRLGRSVFGGPRTFGDRRRLFVTMQRRAGDPSAMTAVAHSTGLLATGHDLDVVMTLPSDPVTRAIVHRELDGCPGVSLVETLGYTDRVATLAGCDLVMSDVGELEEEAPFLGKPLLVLRTATERPEAVWAGCAELVDTRRPDLEAAATKLLVDRTHYRRMAIPASPFGDGRAADRIVARLLDRLADPFEPPLGDAADEAEIVA